MPRPRRNYDGESTAEIPSIAGEPAMPSYQLIMVTGTMWGAETIKLALCIEIASFLGYRRMPQPAHMAKPPPLVTPRMIATLRAGSLGLGERCAGARA